MQLRSVKQTVRAVGVSEGAGVTVYRTIGTPSLRNLDPFLMLDHFGSDNPNEYIAGFPDHPHRGFITLTYMLDGHMLHRDSMGNKGDLQSGGIQWMKAGSGVIHSEMPQQTEGLMRGFQLWINLPAKEKMSSPAYQDYSKSAIPELTLDFGKVKIISGKYQDDVGPISDPATQIQYLDVDVQNGKEFHMNLDTSYQAFMYLYEGDAIVTQSVLSQHTLGVLSSGDRLQVKAGESGARFILVAGHPIGEPIVQYGPFVMNTQKEVQQAFEDFRDGKLVREKASLQGH